jgi:hypothetical protein
MGEAGFKVQALVCSLSPLSFFVFLSRHQKRNNLTASGKPG